MGIFCAMGYRPWVEWRQPDPWATARGLRGGSPTHELPCPPFPSEAADGPAAARA